MSDAPVSSTYAPPPATTSMAHDDAAAMGRGLVNGLLLSLPLWALIVLAVAAIF
jgi:hypothetical protein